MALTERALLYVTAIVLAWLLFFGDRTSSPPTVEDPDAASGASHPFRVTDAAGRVRIEIGLGEQGQPSVKLKGADGSTELALFADDNGAAGIVVHDAQGRRATVQVSGNKAALSLQSGDKARMELVAAPDGGAEVVLSGPPSEPAAVLRRTREGRSELRLENGVAGIGAFLHAERSGLVRVNVNGAKGGQTVLAVTPDGDAEVDVRSTASGVQAFLHTDGTGTGEISLRAKDGQRGAAMVLLPTGELGIAAKGPDGKTGPMMQLGADGLGEVSVTGPDGRSGPALMRLPDGVASMFVRGAQGSSGPSMLLLPNGTAQLGVAAKAGKGQAVLRAEPDGESSLVIFDSKGTPIATVPAGKK